MSFLIKNCVKNVFTCAFAAANTATRYNSPDLNPKNRYAIVKKCFTYKFFAINPPCDCKSNVSTYTFAVAKVPKFSKQALKIS